MKSLCFEVKESFRSKEATVPLNEVLVEKTIYCGQLFHCHILKRNRGDSVDLLDDFLSKSTLRNIGYLLLKGIKVENVVL